ncbi:hypothetical protein NYQ43_04350 [Xanthomonas translucens pv. translucens]|uniref:hypothetical protein n=1 Tax=Xanthomonas campestris pv. translucens TaxID=343 RepID=UPI0021B7404E|nr:hypothetical protein [Xanthomonas translucens]MCT8284945.1 hypothetical protein [Xanthomonas translucens pv. translucens]MCT8302603.1 hypothetical protein [Xanthomonas translucens pv. translucens]
MTSPDTLVGTPRQLGDFSEWGTELLVPFEVRELKFASVLWLNERWFKNQNKIQLNVEQRATIEKWILDEFAYCVPEDSYSNIFGDKSKVVFADRYGSSGLGPHGGSGRAAVFGSFHVKGVGPTPLVASSTDWWHSHGGMWLEEAIREGIYSEIVKEEFPYGASSVIAIIDIGVRCLLPNGKLGKRKALLVRELEVRPAHMERACVFKLDEFPPTRLKDVERVRQAVNRYSHLFGSIDGLTDMFHRFGQQAGYGQVHRLFHGGYFTSNLSVLGRLLDFGGFRSVGNWHRARSMDHIPGFGEERAMLQIAVRSIAFYFRKYLLNGVSPSASVLDNAVHNGIESAFAEECLKIWGGKFSRSSYNEIVVHVMKRFFERQQRTYVSYQLGNLPADRWVHGELRDYLLTNDRETLVTPEIRETVDIVEAHSLTPGETLVRLLCALRILMTRELLFREDLQSSIYEAIGAEDGEEPPQADVVASTIESMVARSRRDWDLGVGRLGIIAQTMAGGLAILLSFDEINMKVVMHVRSDFEANKSPESRLRFGEWSTIPVNEENLGYLKYFSNCKTALWYLDSDTLVSVSRRFNIEATNLPLVLRALERYTNSRDYRGKAVAGTANIPVN